LPIIYDDNMTRNIRILHDVEINILPNNARGVAIVPKRYCVGVLKTITKPIFDSNPQDWEMNESSDALP
jgi:hypothetical protein